MDIFKGYIPLKGKKPLEGYKNRKEFYTWDYIRKSDNDYGGVLKDEIIQIDFDSMDEAKIVKDIVADLGIRCHILKTDRGMHFYFRNAGVKSRKIKVKTPIGLTIDVGLGTKNAVIPLKVDGVTRRWLSRDEHIDTLPLWLMPVKNAPDFFSMNEGDGRNQEFFNYILSLQSQGFSKEVIKEILGIINKYVIKTPLPQRELDTIMRDEAFLKETFYANKKFLHHVFANYIKSEERIVKISSNLHIYRGDIYTTKDIEAALIKYLPELNKAKRSETMSYLELISDNAIPAPANYIALKNGVLNIDTMEMREYSPEIILQNKVDYEYIPSAYHEVTDKTLNKMCCNDKDLRLLLEEVVGYMILRRNEMGKAFILTGGGSNGKSTFLDMVKNMLGSENYSSLSLSELGEKFKTAELFNKLANIGDDISKKYIEDDSIFKKLVTGETVNVERKGKDPFEFNNYAKLVFSANKLPRINDTSDGLMRRIVIIPFNAVFSDKDADYDPFIKDKLLTKDATEYLLKLGIEGLQRVLKDKFTVPKATVSEKSEYEMVNNPILAFIEEDNKIVNEIVHTVYLKYSTWCQENGIRSLSKFEFGRELGKQGYVSKVKKIDGKCVRLYCQK